MWIVCCGMPRSGSTVQYLLTKDIVENTGTGKAVGFVNNQVFDDIYQENNFKYERIVIKTHRAFPSVLSLFDRKEAVAIYVYRDMRDVVLSRIHKKNKNRFNYENVDRFVHLNIKSYLQWLSVSPVLISRYEEMVEDLEREALRIANILGVEITKSFASKLAGKYSLEKQKKRIASIDYEGKNVKRKKSGVYVDLETQLHNNHIRSGKSGQWEYELTPQQIAFIEEHAYDWLVSLNYPISQSWIKRKYAVLSSKNKKYSRIKAI